MSTVVPHDGPAPDPAGSATGRAHDVASIGSWPIELTEPALLPVSAWTGHLPFAFWLVQALAPRLVVELGVHAGASYCGFCQAVSLLELPAACFGIDTWDGEAHAGWHGAEVLRTLRAHHDPRYGRFSRLILSTFDAARAYFAEGSIDLLHIDGFHTYEAVKRDFETWRSKLSDRAVVLFHDTGVRERNFGVWELWDELRVDYPHFAFRHASGLGVLGVGRALPGPLRELLALDEAAGERVRTRYSALGQRLVQTAELRNRLGEMTAAIAERDRRLEDAKGELERCRRAVIAAYEAAADAEALERELAEQRARTAELEQALAEKREELGRSRVALAEAYQRPRQAETKA